MKEKCIECGGYYYSKPEDFRSLDTFFDEGGSLDSILEGDLDGSLDFEFEDLSFDEDVEMKMKEEDMSPEVDKTHPEAAHNVECQAPYEGYSQVNKWILAVTIASLALSLFSGIALLITVGKYASH